jgi:hypothetical protein
MTRNTIDEWPRALKALRTAMETFPSQEEIDRSVDAIDQITAFLADLRRHLLQQQPTAARREDLQKATLMLEGFLIAHRGQVLFAESRRTGGRASHDEVSDIPELRRALEELSLDDIRARLLDDSRYSIATLRELGRELGLRVDGRLSRPDLVDVIFKRGFANPRGYEGLREVSHLPKGVTELSAEKRQSSQPSARQDEAPNLKVARRH